MERKYINRYNTFCKSLQTLEKSRHADPEKEFVLAGTVLNFTLTFDISWKVLKGILLKRMGILDFATGSPRETLQTHSKKRRTPQPTTAGSSLSYFTSTLAKSSFPSTHFTYNA